MSSNVLFSAIKNEAPFILEWLAFHRAIGFEQIFICSNDSDDGTTELLDALAQAGEITHFKNSVQPGERPQRLAANRFRLAGLPMKGDWSIWLDADEFLNIHVGDGRVEDLVKVVGDRTGILIPWRLFGDAGSVGIPDRMISDVFVRAASPDRADLVEVKTFFRMDDCIAGFGKKTLHRPLLLGQQKDVLSRFISGTGHPLDAEDKIHQRWARGGDTGRTNLSPAKEISWEIAQINHYSVRNESMMKLKAMRGRGYGPYQLDASNDRHTSDFYVRMNRNECIDRTILRHAEAVNREIQRLMAIQSVREAHGEGLRRTAAVLERLADEEQRARVAAR